VRHRRGCAYPDSFPLLSVGEFRVLRASGFLRVFGRIYLWSMGSSIFRSFSRRFQVAKSSFLLLFATLISFCCLFLFFCFSYFFLFLVFLSDVVSFCFVLFCFVLFCFVFLLGGGHIGPITAGLSACSNEFRGVCASS
jgi:hypothetical protein